MNKIVYGIPLGILLIITIFLWKGLFLHPTKITSALLNLPAPRFTLPSLVHPEKELTESIFRGHISVLNVWASWCLSCQEEHDFLMQLAKDPKIVLLGLNCHDDNKEALHWLEHYGDPYQDIILDKTGALSIDFGIYGTPETFIMDSQGIIRYRHVGQLNERIWEKKLLPVIQKINAEHIN